MPQRDISVDAAKGTSIVLVVCWHVGGLDFLHGMNEPLLLLRMPLFFFASGLFAVGAMRMDFGDFFRRKLSSLLYLYVVWAFLLYLGTDLIREVAYGTPYTLSERFHLFTDPPDTIWFIYALALVYLAGWLTARLPSAVVVGGAVALYIYSIHTVPLVGAPFLHKVLRALPFFLIALRYGPAILAFSRTQSAHWPLFLAVFLALAMGTVGSGLDRVGPVPLAVGLLGIVAVMATARAFRTTAPVRFLAHVGQNSFYVYVMHRGVITVLTVAMVTLEVPQSLMTDLGRIALAVVVPLAVGRWVVRPYLPMLERAPWVRGGRGLALPWRGVPVGARTGPLQVKRRPSDQPSL